MAKEKCDIRDFEDASKMGEIRKSFSCYVSEI